jgi:hypothetical protein
LPSLSRAIKSRIMGCEGHVERVGERRSIYKILVGKSEVQRPLGRPKSGWEDNIKIIRGKVRK